jgi:hypothetical protein
VATAYIAARLRRMIKHLGGPEAPDNTGLQVAYLLICDSVRRYAGGLGKVSQDDIDRAIAFYGDESVDPITEA